MPFTKFYKGAATLLVVAAAIGSFASDKKPLVLKGLDPVLLTQGQEVGGKDSLTTEYGKFLYKFSTQEDLDAFTKEPSKFAVQNDGACLHMATMPGSPNLFLVHDHKIYLLGDYSCVDTVKADPAKFVRKKPVRSDQLLTVAVLMFPGVDMIDYAGPWEVFTHAGFKLFTVAEKAGPMPMGGGEAMIPQYTLDNCPKADFLLLPGGNVPMLEKSDPLMQWINKTAGEAKYTMSVCTGAYWLANAGLLDGKSATTIGAEINAMANHYPNIKMLRGQRFVDNGNIITTAGLSAGIDGALHMVERIQGVDRARVVAAMMEYNWLTKYEGTPKH